jgi:hypothetical protein
MALAGRKPVSLPVAYDGKGSGVGTYSGRPSLVNASVMVDDLGSSLSYWATKRQGRVNRLAGGWYSYGPVACGPIHIKRA